MRNILIVLLLIGLPTAVIMGFLFYGPMFYDKLTQEESPLDKKFSTIVGDTLVVGKMDDYSALDSIPRNGGTTSSLSRSEQVAAASGNRVGDNYYHNIKIDEVVNKNTQFYDLKAANPDELRKAILAQAPENADSGRHSISKMSYGVDWTLDTVQEPGECKLLGVKVITTITMVMPRWIGVENMGEDARQAWNDYLTSVASYGERHNKIMEGVSRQIAERIRFVKKKELCSELIANVNKIGTTMLTDARDRVKRYKSETGGGRQMGVRLPVFADSDLASNQEMAAALNQVDNIPTAKPVMVAEEDIVATNNEPAVIDNVTPPVEEIVEPKIESQVESQVESQIDLKSQIKVSSESESLVSRSATTKSQTKTKLAEVPQAKVESTSTKTTEVPGLNNASISEIPYVSKTMFKEKGFSVLFESSSQVLESRLPSDSDVPAQSKTKLQAK